MIRRAILVLGLVLSGLLAVSAPVSAGNGAGSGSGGCVDDFGADFCDGGTDGSVGTVDAGGQGGGGCQFNELAGTRDCGGGIS